MALNVGGTLNVEGAVNVGDGDATVEGGGDLTVESGATMTVGEDGVTYNGEAWVPKAKLELVRSKQRIELAVEQMFRLFSPFPSLLTELVIIALKMLSVSSILDGWFSTCKDR